jgi:hypothetical protein
LFPKHRLTKETWEKGTHASFLLQGEKNGNTESLQQILSQVATWRHVKPSVKTLLIKMLYALERLCNHATLFQKNTEKVSSLCLHLGMIAVSTYTIFSSSQIQIVLFHSVAPHRLSPINKRVFNTNEMKQEMKTSSEPLAKQGGLTRHIQPFLCIHNHSSTVSQHFPYLVAFTLSMKISIC